MEEKRAWTTREGEILRVEDMETKHILNCLHLLQKRRLQAMENMVFEKMFEEELKKRNMSTLQEV